MHASWIALYTLGAALFVGGFVPPVIAVFGARKADEHYQLRLLLLALLLFVQGLLLVRLAGPHVFPVTVISNGR